MKCPGCNSDIHATSEKCTTCGYAFSKEIQVKLSLYFDLKNELEHLRSTIKTDIWPGLQRVSEKVTSFGDLLTHDRTVQDPETEKAEKAEPFKETRIIPEKAIEEKPPIVTHAASKKSKISTPRENAQFEIHLGQKWLLIVGIVTLVLGVGYFLKYSFEKGWVGPAGRVALAYMWGIAFMTGGNHFRRKFETFGLYLIGGGIAMLYFSTFAAFQIYHLFPQTPSFVIMIIITVLASALSIFYDTKWLAVLGIIGGFLTPVMLTTGQDNQIALMTYMTILNAGLFCIALYKKWDLLNILGFLGTYLLYAAWFADYYVASKFWPSLIFLNIFYLLYSIIPFTYQFFRISSEKINGFFVIIPNSLIAFGYSYHMIKEYFSLEWVSIITISYAFIFCLMAWYLYRKGGQEKEAFIVLSAKSAFFLIITIPIIFSNHWITIFWSVQAASLVWMGIRLNKRGLIIGAYLLLAVAVGKFVSYDYSEVFRFNLSDGYIRDSYMYLILERIITSVLLLGAIYSVAAMLKRAYTNVLSSFFRVKEESSVLYVLFGLLLFLMLNVETSAFFYDHLLAARFAAISILWAVFSVALMMKGFKDNNSLLRKISLALFLITLIKVFRFDMENVSTPYRIMSFIMVGLMLVGASYLYHKFKDRIVSVISEDRESEKRQA